MNYLQIISEMSFVKGSLEGLADMVGLTDAYQRQKLESALRKLAERQEECIKSVQAQCEYWLPVTK